MLSCSCGETFEDSNEAMEHVQTEHAELCDQKLEEYITDSINDAYEELISGEEDEN